MVAPRGECTKGGKKINSLPKDQKGNIQDTKLCERLTSCDLFDFRPKTGSSMQKDGGEAGAYTAKGNTYFIPGRRLQVPTSPIPQDGAVFTHPRISLMFLPAKACKIHTVYFSPVKAKVEAMAGATNKQLMNGANTFSISWNLGFKQFYWRVKPSEKDCPGSKASAVWTFTRSRDATNGNSKGATT